MSTLIEKHLATYSPEACAACYGTGRLGLNGSGARRHLPPKISAPDGRGQARLAQLYPSREFLPECNVCKGAGVVLVLQPPRKCPVCSGDGRGLQPRCLKCRGTGWMLAWIEA